MPFHSRAHSALKSLFTLLVCGLGAVTQARAANFDLTLTAPNAPGTSVFGAATVYGWYQLTGLDASNPITLSNGDTVNVTMNLSSPFVLPSGGIIQFGLSNTATSWQSHTVGSFSALNAGAVVGGATNDGYTGYGVGNVATFNTASGASTVKFDKVLIQFTVTGMSQSQTVFVPYFQYVTGMTLAPEPQTYVLVALGMIGAAAVARRRQRQ